MMNTEVKVSPHPALMMLAMSRIAGHFDNVQEPLQEAVREVLIPRIRANFFGEEAAGDKWAELAPSTRERRPKFARERPKLQVRGKLREEAISEGIWLYDESGGSEGEGRLEVRNFRKAPYAFYHQQPDDVTVPTRYGGELPARPFIAVNDSDIKEIEEIFQRHGIRGVEVNLPRGRRLAF